jgi:patatin-like phospholipase/acyl hydrolase
MVSGEEAALDPKASPKRGPRPFIERRANSLKTRRHRLPWPTDRPYRILSLDGGGIRGIYAASILADIEAEITGGEPIADYFDDIAGTSTGGIIAIGLGLKKKAADIKALYVEKGNRVFPAFWSRHPRLKFARQLFRVLHDHRILEELLYDVFKDAKLGDSFTRLVIPAFLGPKTQIAVLKTDHHPDFQKDHLMAAWEAARATSAAPAFFSGHGGEDYVFLDGGVWANNPIMAVVVDALSAYDITREQIEVFSIGTGNQPYEISKFAVRGGFFQWLEIIKGAMFLTTDNAQAQATLLLGPERILRLEPEGEAAAIELDDWASALALVPLAKRDLAANSVRIANFFRNKVAPRHRFYTEPTTEEPEGTFSL